MLEEAARLTARRVLSRHPPTGAATVPTEGTAMICLEYAGPHRAGVPIDPASDEYIWALTDWDAPVLVHIAPTLPPPRPPRPPLTIRLRHSDLPPLPRWPLADAPGRLTEAKARQAIAWLVTGYNKAEIGRALGVSRSSVTSLAHGRAWAHVPWPSGYGPCRPGCSQVSRLTEATAGSSPTRRPAA